MNKSLTVRLIAALALVVLIAFFAYEKWGTRDNDPRSAMLAAMPATASTILFADFTSLRQSPFAAQFMIPGRRERKSIRTMRNFSTTRVSTTSATSIAWPSRS